MLWVLRFSSKTALSCTSWWFIVCWKKRCHFIFLPSLCQILTDFGWLVLIFNKMALFFLGVPIIFTISSFEFHQVNLSWLHRQWWVAPTSPDLNDDRLNPLDYQVWEKCWSLITSCNQSQKQFPSLKMKISQKVLGGYFFDSHCMIVVLVSAITQPLLLPSIMFHGRIIISKHHNDHEVNTINIQQNRIKWHDKQAANGQRRPAGSTVNPVN